MNSACMHIPVGFAVLLCWSTHFGVKLTDPNGENVSVKPEVEMVMVEVERCG